MMRQDEHSESSNATFSEEEMKGKTNQNRVARKRPDVNVQGLEDEFYSPARKMQRVDGGQRNNPKMNVQSAETFSGCAGGRDASEGRKNPAIERLAQLEQERQQILSSLRTDRMPGNQLPFHPPQSASSAAVLPAGLGYGRGLTAQTFESALLAQRSANPSIIAQLRRLQALNSVPFPGSYPIQNRGLQGLSGFPPRHPLHPPPGTSLANVLALELGRGGLSSTVAATLQNQGRGLFPGDMQPGFAPSMNQNSAAPSLPAVSSQRALIARSHTGIPLSLPVILAQPLDEVKLSSHQVLLRHQIEAFKASEDDVTTHTRGRNKPIALGQVGIRCRHCAKLPVARRRKGSTYFPATLMGLYQAAQNMSTSHMQNGLCTEMPEAIKQDFGRLLASKVTSSGAGRPYWAESAKNLGLVDTEEGIRFVRDLGPNAQLGSPPRTLC